MRLVPPLLYCGLAALCLALPVRADSWAVLVGVSKYQSPQIASLKYPAADAAGIRDALVDPQLGGFKANHVLMLTDDNATGGKIKNSIDEFLAPGVKKGDQVVIFLAGHGVTKGVGTDAKSYLLPTDVKGLTTAALDSTAVDLRDFSSRLGKLPASQFVLFVDACREDPTPGRGIKGNQLTDVMSRSVQVVPDDTDRPVSSVTMFACGVGQRAFEDPTLQHGVFTYWILDGIRKAPVPTKPDGAVNMATLYKYVSEKVEAWAKKSSENGDFEVTQEPQIDSVNPPVVIMKVKRPLTGTPIAVDPPKVDFDTFPETARITANGQPIGTGDVSAELPASGTYQVEVSAPGYQPVTKPVKAVDGYEQKVSVRLQPVAQSPSTTGNSPSAEMYKKALALEQQEQWEAAAAGYDAVRQADPKNAAAYEHLADLQARGGDQEAAIGTLIELVKNMPSAHSYALLARAYADFATREDDEGKKGRAGGDYRVPQTTSEAAEYSRRAADEAVRRDAQSAEAQAALGFALVAADQGGQNKRPALSAFGKALFMDDKNPANHYAMGYGIRFFNQNEKNAQTRKSELNRAVTALQQALKLRPEYYDAHRELAYCYHLLDDTNAAIKEYDMANANRGNAQNKDEVAGVNVALAGLHQQEAQKSTGQQREEHQQASGGYLSDAKETSPNLKKALRFLAVAGVGTRLTDYLPADLRKVLDLSNIIRTPSNLPNVLPNLGGGRRFPF